MTEKPEQIKLAYLALAVFADDGALDMKELDTLLHFALHDNQLDDAERRILANVFDHIDEDHVAPDVWERIKKVRAQYAI